MNMGLNSGGAVRWQVRLVQEYFLRISFTTYIKIRQNSFFAIVRAGLLCKGKKGERMGDSGEERRLKWEIVMAA